MVKIGQKMVKVVFECPLSRITFILTLRHEIQYLNGLIHTSLDYWTKWNYCWRMAGSDRIHRKLSKEPEKEKLHGENCKKQGCRYRGCNGCKCPLVFLRKIISIHMICTYSFQGKMKYQYKSLHPQCYIANDAPTTILKFSRTCLKSHQGYFTNEKT